MRVYIYNIKVKMAMQQLLCIQYSGTWYMLRYSIFSLFNFCIPYIIYIYILVFIGIIYILAY